MATEKILPYQGSKAKGNVVPKILKGIFNTEGTEGRDTEDTEMKKKADGKPM